MVPHGHLSIISCNSQVCATTAGLAQETKPAVSSSACFIGSMALNRSLGPSLKFDVTALGKERWEGGVVEYSDCSRFLLACVCAEMV